MGEGERGESEKYGVKKKALTFKYFQHGRIKV